VVDGIFLNVLDLDLGKSLSLKHNVSGTLHPTPHSLHPNAERRFVEAVRHLTMTELEAGLGHIRQSPKDEGVLELIVRRPRHEEREVLEQGELHLIDGLVGDSWKMRSSSRTPDGSPHPEMQLNIMNARAIALVARDKERWQLAGDQLYIEFDLSSENLPAGTRLSIGSAVIEVTPLPHTGCKKFVSRFGLDAMKFVNSPVGRELRLRGINARVVEPGVISVGNVVRKI
jgi:hypothetical protein